MLRAIKRTLLWAGAALLGVALLFGALIVWPDPLFAFSLGTGKIVVASDRPIPSAGGERFLRDCERLLERTGDSACSSSRAPRPGASPIPCLEVPPS